ncbi:MAG: LLM class flavin-dependent oxidoreductase [Alicyclobacillus herbarius]|uniref:LLM class flavin-dependent oxidoreductase n=1 Tax=Alicyclobacillus herbarius TaxID=122960 RepID=UPI0023521285|nr:LLM class flavin-dependent oxidoreductase [Alicyclobacillus herbarius]MCL6634115.1 LLM class flavin-dependent oxidoreductase [Alicyclobacillus herbarius]
MKLSVLDQSPIGPDKTPQDALRETVQLAQAVERWGYFRFWVSEHHNTTRLAGTTPEVLLAHLGAHTKRIRLGSGGVLLPYYSPLKVAENFRMLEALYPGRIDLGLGRAPGGDMRTMRAMLSGSHKSLDDYPDQVKTLMHFLHDDLPEDHRYHGIHAMPTGPGEPEVWLLGSSDASAYYAASLGTRFSFAQFINGYGGPEVVRMYKESFRPSPYLDHPEANAAIFALCAETEEKAEELAAIMDLRLLWLEQGRGGEIPTAEEARAYTFTPWEERRVQANRARMVFGTPDKVRDQLTDLARTYGIDEWILVTITDTFASRLRSYELIAEAFGLTA